jgi:hypothetical protein
LARTGVLKKLALLEEGEIRFVDGRETRVVGRRFQVDDQVVPNLAELAPAHSF